MEVSDIQFIPIRPKDGLLGFVSFVINSQLFCGSIGVYSRPGGGIRLVYPKINNKGNQYATFHPIRPELTRSIETQVENKIKELLPSGMILGA